MLRSVFVRINEDKTKNTFVYTTTTTNNDNNIAIKIFIIFRVTMKQVQTTQNSKSWDQGEKKPMSV